MPSCFGFHSYGESRRLPKESEDAALLAKELNSLSMHEREKLYEEVGVVRSHDDGSTIQTFLGAQFCGNFLFFFS